MLYSSFHTPIWSKLTFVSISNIPIYIDKFYLFAVEKKTHIALNIRATVQKPNTLK